MRFSKQVVLTTTNIFTGRNVRRATPGLLANLGVDGAFVTDNRTTFGVARIEGREVPVVRVQNRVWSALSTGKKYSA